MSRPRLGAAPMSSAERQARRRARLRQQRRTGCEIDSRNRHVAEAELAPAPAKAAHSVSLCERLDAPSGAKDTSRPNGTYRNL